MKYWKSLAAAMEVHTTDRALEALEELDRVFRPLAATLGPEDDIAVDFSPAAGQEPAR
jgi:hypothetical protein